MPVEDFNISSVELVWIEYHVAESNLGFMHGYQNQDFFCRECQLFKKLYMKTSIKWKKNLVRPYYELHIYRMK
jgi:hypothetical protein